MFLKRKILNALEFGEYVSIEVLHDQFSNIPLDKFGREVVMLVGMGFVAYDEKRDISLKRITSVYEYTLHVRKTLFGIVVSFSAIASAFFSFFALLE